MNLKQGRVLSVGCGRSLANEVAKYAILQQADTIVVPHTKDVSSISCEISNITANIPNITILPFSEAILCNCLICSTTNLSSTDKLLLCSQFIEIYNATHGSNLPIELAKELLLLLDEVCANGVLFTEFYRLDDMLSEGWKLKFLKEFCKWWTERGDAEVSCRHVDALIDVISGRKVVIAGIIFGRLFKRFLYKVIHENIADDYAIVLPYVDLGLAEQGLQHFKKDHYQYWTISLLNELGIQRCDIQYLGENSSNRTIDLLFSFDLPSESYVYAANNIKVSTFRCEGAEAVDIIDKCTAHNIDLSAMHEIVTRDQVCVDERQFNEHIRKRVLFLCPNSLAMRISSLISASCERLSNMDSSHIISCLILGTIDVVTSVGEASHVLAVLKNPVVTLGYNKEEYSNLVTIFEAQVIRAREATGFAVVGDIIKEYVPQLEDFWNRFTDAVGGLSVLLNDKCTMGYIAEVHLCCIEKLIGNRIFHTETGQDVIISVRKLFSAFVRNCANMRVFTLDSYRGIHASLMKRCFDLERVSLVSNNFTKKELVILSGFSEEEYFKATHTLLLSGGNRRRLNLPSEEEYRGYFLHALHGLFHANYVYISRSINSSGNITTEPILLRYLNFLLTFVAGNSALASEGVTTPCISSDKCEKPNRIGTNEHSVHFPDPDKSYRQGAMANLTAEAVDILINNPYVFYLRYILDIMPSRPIGTGFPGISFAGVVHRVLRRYMSHSALNSDFCMLNSIAEEELKLASKECPHMINIWWPKLKATMKEFFEVDRNRKDSILKIDNRQDFLWNIEECVNVSGKCDRVEYNANKSIDIVRYKVGALPSQIDVQFGFAAREIVEAICVSETVDCCDISFAYWKLTPRGIEVVEIKDFSNIVERAKTGVSTLLMRYFNGEIPFSLGRDDAKFTEYDLFQSILK